jgi:hypothetical protein
MADAADANQAQATSLEEAIQVAIAEAHEICERLGAQAQACAAAWDVVEELQAEASHQKQKPAKSAFQVYCEANPDADECRIYED